MNVVVKSARPTTLSSTSLTIIGYLQAVRSAEEDRLKLLSEVSALGALLDILRHRLDNTNGNGDGVSNRLVKAGIGNPLDQCYQALGSTVEELERIASHADTGKSSSFAEKMKRVRWPFRQEDIRTMLGKIERLKSLISLAFQTSLVEFIDKTRDELVVVGLNVQKIETAISALEADQRAHMKETELVQINLQALGFMLQDSANGIANVSNMVTTIGRNQQDQMVQGNQMQVDLAIIKESMYGQELQDILKWLSPLDFSEKQNAAFEKHAPGTGEWFLEHPKFVAWRRGEYNTLWCPGNPGVGKSMMVSLVVHELGREIPEEMAVVFIYFEYKTKLTTTQVAEALLKQLVRRRITQSGLELLRKHKAGNHPTFKELFDIVKVEVESYARVFVVLDALDETATHIWVPLIGHLRTLSGISLLATSRDLGDIAAEFRRDRQLDIMADDGDVRRYIEGRLSGSTGGFKRLLEADPSLNEDIVAGIMERADGMFLLAQLHLNSLETKARITDLRRTLTKLPRDLDATYDEAMKRISDEHKELAYQIIAWLIHAVQPMTIGDLQYALAIEDGMTALDVHDLYDEASLTTICVGLVVLRAGTADSEPEDVADPRPNNKIVGLVHYTTQEYFRRNHDVSSQLADSAYFAITCLRYLSFDIFRVNGPLYKNSGEQLTERPLAKYAIFSWGEHARAHWDDATVRALAMELLHDDQRVVTLGSLPCRTTSLPAIHLCAYFGLKDYLRCLLEEGSDINSKDSEGDTAVTEAAIAGREEIMQLLLAREDVDVNPKGSNGATPLIRAAMNGHQNIVELLLARDDVDANWRDDDRKTPIVHAAERGHSALVERLLARDGVDINSQDKQGATALAVAIVMGHNTIIRLLLARNDLDISWRSSEGDSHLGLAAWCGNKWSAPIPHRTDHEHDITMELLLKRHDKDINSQGSHGRTPLALAALRGNKTMVQLLLARDDVDVNRRDNFGRTPIFYALKHDSILELLLARDDMDINPQDEDGYTPLASAIIGEQEASARLLLARDDLDISLRDNDGETHLALAALYYRTERGQDTIVELLLARGQEGINSRNSLGRTPLALAVVVGNETMVQLLLERDDVDVNPHDDHRNTPIIYAALKGRSNILKLLLARGDVDVNSQGHNGQTPLTVAIIEEHEAIVQLLLARDDLDTSLKDDSNNTHLVYAAYRGNEGVVKWLLAQGNVDVNSKSLNGQVALTFAAFRDHSAVVKLLLDQDGIDINTVDSTGSTPLDIAEMHGHHDVVELLQVAGARTAAALREEGDPSRARGLIGEEA